MLQLHEHCQPKSSGDVWKIVWHQVELGSAHYGGFCESFHAQAFSLTLTGAHCRIFFAIGKQTGQ